MGERGRNEVGQLGCTSIKEVDENGGIGPCRTDPRKSGFDGVVLLGRSPSDLIDDRGG